MVLKRRLLFWRCEEFWFDEAGYLASTADVAALRSHGPAPAHDCAVPERTLLVPLDADEEGILAAYATRAKTSIRQARKSVRVERAETLEQRKSFYDAYLPFAAEKRLLAPDPSEEEDLEIFLACDAEGNLLQAAAFLHAPAAGLYRYRYGVYVRKSQANAIVIHEAILRAKALGCRSFDLGGVTAGAKPGTAEAGINFFKSQFGGRDAESHLFLRGNRYVTRLLLRALQASGLSRRFHFFTSIAGRLTRS